MSNPSTTTADHTSAASVYLISGGAQQGPFQASIVRDSAAKGGLDLDHTLAWYEGLSDWTPLRNIPDLSPSLGSLPPPPPPGTIVAVEAAAGGHAPPSVTAASSGPVGVGGWLLFFCIALAILSPLLGFGSMLAQWSLYAEQLRQVSELYSAFLWESLTTGFILIVGLVAGITIWSGSPYGREIARRILLLRLIGGIVIGVVALMLLGDKFAAFAFGTVFKLVLQDIIFFTVWWLYFLKSKRVLNTYGPLPAST